MNQIHRLFVLLLIAITACFSVRAADDETIALEEDTADPKLSKIVIIAGEQVGNAEHQYWAGSVVLAKLLRQIPGIHVALVRGGWPKNPEILNNAKSIVLYMEGGEGGAVQPLTIDDRFEQLKKHVLKGAGLATFHKAAMLPPDLGQKMIELQGGFFDLKTGTKGHWLVAFNKFPDHPTMRGLKPYTFNDGYCIGNTFAPDMKGVTPLLFAPKGAAKVALSAESTTAPKDITAWAFERPNGGRAFASTGLHSHRYLTEESIRKFTLNGILWSAKLEVPADGANVVLDEADLNKNIEIPKPKPAAVKKTE